MPSTADPLAQPNFRVSARAAIAAVVAASRHFGALGWTPATAGNFSVRTAESVAMTRSGCGKRQLRNADVALTTLRPPTLDGLSAEAPLAFSANGAGFPPLWPRTLRLGADCSGRPPPRRSGRGTSHSLRPGGATVAMTYLVSFDAVSGDRVSATRDRDQIAAAFDASGIQLDYWDTPGDLPATASVAQIVAAYSAPLKQLSTLRGYTTSDVVALTPDHPDRDALRAKFLAEHVHADDEVRFFIAGRGAFYLHIDHHVQALVCERGDLVLVPSGTRHWFDAGPRPDFVAIRLFADARGWVAEYTGDPIADRIPRFEPGNLTIE